MDVHGSVRQSPVRIQTKKDRRWFKKGAWLVGSLLIVGTFVAAGISVYTGWKMTHPDLKPVDQSPHDFGLDYTVFETQSEYDGTRLSGWTLETTAQPKGVIIMAHGYRNNRLSAEIPALSIAADLVEDGFHVVMFDFRNSGSSGGKQTTIGYLEKYDLLTIVQFVQDEYADLPLGIAGYSMGAVTALLAAAEDTSIRAVLADSPFADLRDYLKVNMSHWTELPNFPFTPLILGLMPMITQIDVDEVSPRQAVQDVHAPILFIHGEDDEAIPYRNSVEIMENSVEGQAELWTVPGAGHIQSYPEATEAYKEKMLHFFNEAFSSR